MTEQPPAALAQWNNLVMANSSEFGLDPFVISAQIWTECEQDVGDPTLTRYEKRYQYFWHPDGYPLYNSNLSVDQNRKVALDAFVQVLGQEVGTKEFNDQSTSFGLLQIMLATAREHGFRGNAEDLFAPSAGIQWGCRYHQVCLHRAHGDQHRALRLYNGSDVYADKVLKRAIILRSY